MSILWCRCACKTQHMRNTDCGGLLTQVVSAPSPSPVITGGRRRKQHGQSICLFTLEKVQAAFVYQACLPQYSSCVLKLAGQRVYQCFVCSNMCSYRVRVQKFLQINTFKAKIFLAQICQSLHVMDEAKILINDTNNHSCPLSS